MRILPQAALTLGLLALAVTGSAAHAHLASAQSDVVGHVYVDDNTGAPAGNTVAGFDRHADGSLTAMAGSPFAVGGAGTGTGLAAQGALQLSGDGRYLLAADAGSNQISVLRIGPDGALSPVAGSPFASGGNEPVSIAVRGRLVYVANAGAGGSNYTGFVLDDGHLTPLAGATTPVAPGVVDVLLSRDGRTLVGTRVGTATGTAPIDGNIDSFAVGEDGHLTPAQGSPFTAQANGPFGSAFNPVDDEQLFVSNAHAGTGNGSVSAFAVAPGGALSPISLAPYPNLQTAPCWLEIARDGRSLYTSNTASSSLSTYAVDRDGFLALRGNTTLNGPTGVNTRPVDLRLAPDGRDLYVVEDGVNAVGALAVSGDGSLTELSAPSAALPAGVTGFASGIVVTQR